MSIYKYGCKVLSCLTLLLVIACTAATAQINVNYTQYMDNLTPINAAYSLLDTAGSLSTIVRKQFTGIEGAPTTIYFNASLPIKSIKGSTGIIVKNDNLAVEDATSISLFFGKAIQLDERSFLSVSLSGGFRRYVANYSLLDPNSIDPVFRDDIHDSRINLGFGVMYYSDNYYVGISVPELSIKQLGNASVDNPSDFKNTYYLAGAFLKDLGYGFKLKPATLIAFAKNEPLRANVSGTIYLQEVLGLGANYLYSTQNKQLAGIISFNFNAVRLGYSYQFSASSSKLAGINSAIHEVTLNYRFGRELSTKLL